jgi:hypothetical protein
MKQGVDDRALGLGPGGVSLGPINIPLKGPTTLDPIGLPAQGLPPGSGDYWPLVAE